MKKTPLDLKPCSHWYGGQVHLRLRQRHFVWAGGPGVSQKAASLLSGLAQPKCTLSH